MAPEKPGMYRKEMIRVGLVRSGECSIKMARTLNIGLNQNEYLKLGEWVVGLGISKLKSHFF